MAHHGRQNADEALALALATGQTLRDAAQETGVSERTAARRWADADFRRQVSALRGDLMKRSLGRLADGMTEAANVLRQLLGAQSEGIRLGAARALIALGIKVREAVENEERITALEASIEELEGRVCPKP